MIGANIKNNINMKWIKSNEKEPSKEGKYFCKYNNVKLVLEFVKIKPKEHFKTDEIKFWTEDINGTTHMRSHEELLWLEEN